MTFPTFVDFVEIDRFLSRFDFAFHQGEGRFTAFFKHKPHVGFEGSLMDPGIRTVVVAEDKSITTDIDIGKDFDIGSLDDFKWKLFCILKKTGKL